MIALLWLVGVAVFSFGSGYFLYSGLHKKKERRTLLEGEPPESSGPPDQSLRDLVTGLYNRKHLLARIEQGMARCLREKKQLALILWDIDGFMEFNNRFGQREGDRFLRKVGDIIRLSIRVYDEAFRAGPDEFCTILTPADSSIAAEVTKRVSNAVSKNLFEGEEIYAAQAFSISAGVVYYPGEHTVPEALLHAAMQALYQKRLTHAN